MRVTLINVDCMTVTQIHITVLNVVLLIVNVISTRVRQPYRHAYDIQGESLINSLPYESRGGNRGESL